MVRFDLCVIGAGPAGVAAAVRATDLGKRVALVEAGRTGGAGLHDGALSSKTLWHLSGDYARARRDDRGYPGASLPLAWPAVRAQVEAATQEAQALLTQQLDALRPTAPADGPGITRLFGRARFVAPHVIALDTGGQVEAEHFLLAVGSRPRVPPDVTFDGQQLLSSDHIERLAAPPRRLAIVGAGVVGCEYATIFANFGQTQVELINRQARILPSEDADVAQVVETSFAQLGITMHHEAQVLRQRHMPDGIELVLKTPIGEVTRVVDVVLYAIGRVPATADLGLEVAGVQVDKGGGVIGDGTRTTAPHIWAAGDCTTDLMLANTAEAEGRHAVETMFGQKPRPVLYEAQAAIFFLRPEVASVGLGELAAQKAGIGYRAAVISNRLNRRNIAMRATDGFVKLIARHDGRLLGLRVVGPQAGSTMQGVALLLERGGHLADLDACTHPHPAVTEGVQEAARLLLGRSLFKPAAMGDLCRIIEG